VSTIAEWLTSLDMSEYAERFAENGGLRALVTPQPPAATEARPRDAAELRQLTVMFADADKRLARRTLLVPVSKSGKPRAVALNAAAIALRCHVRRGTNTSSPSRSLVGHARPCSTHQTASGVAPV